MGQHIRDMYRSLGARRAAVLGTGVFAALVVVLIVLLNGSGTGKPAHPVATVSAPTVTTPTTSPSVPAPRPVKHRRKPAPHHATASGASATGGRTSSATGGRTSAASQPSAPSAAGPISLVLHGGGDASASACGATHHYRTYATGASVAFSGTVHPIPSGHWTVKLKIKLCAGGGFRDFSKVDAQRDKHRGTFSGSFPAPAAGRYAVRALLYVDGTVTTKSAKRHFATH